jgi:hypothetical protein
MNPFEVMRAVDHRENDATPRVAIPANLWTVTQVDGRVTNVESGDKTACPVASADSGGRGADTHPGSSRHQPFGQHL